MFGQLIYRAAKRYIRRVDGFSYDFSKNGEEWILQRTAAFDFAVVFDVGANVGSWTRNAQRYFAKARYHCFELSNETFPTLATNIQMANCYLNNFGLSDTNAEIQYKDYGKDSGVNTLLLGADFHDEKISPVLKNGSVRRGDDYCRSAGVDFIDFLKIDVEGAEHHVLNGFTKMLSEKRVRIVQFEYGYTHGDAKFLMRDFFKLFASYGYIVGKLRKGKVEFVEWSYPLNDFNSGPNFIAVRKSDTELIERLT